MAIDGQVFRFQNVGVDVSVAQRATSIPWKPLNSKSMQHSTLIHEPPSPPPTKTEGKSVKEEDSDPNLQ